MQQDLYDEIVKYIVEHQNHFYRLAFSYVHNPDDAMDIVQNAICKALEHYGTLKNLEAIRTWFYRILVNESLQCLKRQKREILLGENPSPEAPYYEKGYEPQDHISQQLQQLAADTQTIIKLRFFEELSLKEIASILELNLNTVKAKLYRGLEQLKVNIQEVNI